jgi:hypothetical protein
VDAGLAVQRVDAEAAVVGERGKAGQVGGGARLELGIVDEAGAGFLGLGQVELGRAEALDPERRDQRADLAQLASLWVAMTSLSPIRVHRPPPSAALEDLAAADPGEAEQAEQAFLVEGRALGGQLRLDDRAVGGEHEIAVAAGVLSSA